MMKRFRCRRLVLVLASLLCMPSAGSAQLTGVGNGQWRYLGGDAGHTRFSPLTQINASNFSPVGQTPAQIRNHPLLKGMNVPNTGGTGHSIQMVMGDLLVQTTEDLRGEADVSEKGLPLLHARDKRTGRILASVELPMPGQYGMMTYMHDGRQYILLQAGSERRNQPGALVALTLP